MTITCADLSDTLEGIRSCTQSYVSEISSGNERTQIMAKLGAATTLAYVFGPASGVAFAQVIPARIGPIIIDKLNMPGIANATLLFMVLVFLMVVFHEEGGRQTNLSEVINGEFFCV